MPSHNLYYLIVLGTYGLSGNDYKVDTLPKSYFNVIGFIMHNS